MPSTLLDYLQTKAAVEALSRTEILFKRKHPTRYIQVKMRMIQEGKENNLLAICTDISQIKRIEKQ